jgi:hypothetical protein
MTTRRALSFLAIVAAILALAGCPTGTTTAFIIGNLGLDGSGPGWVYGDTEFHVLLFDADTIVDLDDLSYPAPMASMNGTLPGGTNAVYTSINYVMTDVPAGVYYLMAWVDIDGTSGFSRDFDYYGFYDYVPGVPPAFKDSQPIFANVNVPAAGIVDVDLVLGVVGAPEAAIRTGLDLTLSSIAQGAGDSG